MENKIKQNTLMLERVWLEVNLTIDNLYSMEELKVEEIRCNKTIINIIEALIEFDRKKLDIKELEEYNKELVKETQKRLEDK